MKSTEKPMDDCIHLSPIASLRFLSRMRGRGPEIFRDLHDRYGETVALHVPFMPIVSSKNPGLIKHVLCDRPENFGKGNYANALSPLWGKDSVQLSDGEDWRRQRRACAFSSGPSHQGEYHAAIVRHATAVFDQMADEARHDAAVPIYFRFKKIFMRSLCDVWFGVLTEAEIDTITDLLGRATDLAAKRMLVFPRIPMWVPTPDNRRYQEVAHEIHCFVEDMMKRAKDTGKGKDLLRHIVSSIGDDRKRGMSFIEARNNLVMFLLAAYEFPSMGWALYFLGKNQDAMERLIREVDEALKGAAPSVGEVDQLLYAKRCFQETLRLVPPAPLMARKVMEDDTYGGLLLKKGTTVVIPSIALQKDGAFWRTPEVFDPSHFEQEIPPHAFIPFGAGQRGCIGEGLTWQLKLTVMAMFFQRFNFTLQDDREIKPHDRLKLFPAGGVPVALSARQSHAEKQ